MSFLWKGEMYWPDGQSYVGQFEYNYMSGQGLFTYPNGSTYEGAVLKAATILTLTPTLTLFLTRITILIITLMKGLRHGEGCFTDTSGASYTGSWIDGVRKGMGTQVQSLTLELTLELNLELTLELTPVTASCPDHRVFSKFPDLILNSNSKQQL